MISAALKVPQSLKTLGVTSDCLGAGNSPERRVLPDHLVLTSFTVHAPAGRKPGYRLCFMGRSIPVQGFNPAFVRHQAVSWEIGGATSSRFRCLVS